MTSDTTKTEGVGNGQGAEAIKPVNLELASDSKIAGSGVHSAPTEIRLHPSALMPNRPIEESNLEVVGMLMGGHRPIMRASSTSAVVLVDSVDGTGPLAHRPVAAVDLHVTGMLMNRPVASNQIDDPFTLMGFLD
ncbi:MAG: hypothetical protein HC825_07110 [Oscillatoriales cyanobacterium RM1_1_9]|nr:hypothetical protein [Oscillatoriales cyanobacterium SM2_3_0]NJO45145.1 hypothetical protein [Oscillatoriales cyanobacterium RM2_1_1]NJO71508.1 hypothetical protein [Oscillatoriales cyanobacterium RM1_1_9]